MKRRRKPYRPSKALLEALDGDRLDIIQNALLRRPRPPLRKLIEYITDIVECSGRRTTPDDLRALDRQSRKRK